MKKNQHRRTALKRRTKPSRKKNLSAARRLRTTRRNIPAVREEQIPYSVQTSQKKIKTSEIDRNHTDAGESWDFRKADTKEYTHCFHAYPAMMIPQIARRLIGAYGKQARLLFDPYCGTGTSLVEANLKGINAIGTDLNPLARHIAAAKTTPIDLQILDLFLHNFVEFAFSMRFRTLNDASITVPKVHNIDFWYSPKVKVELAVLREYTRSIEHSAVRAFFEVALSETARETSYLKSGEFKMVRRKDLDKQAPDVIGIFEQKLARNRNGLGDFLRDRGPLSSSSVYSFNSVAHVPENIISPKSVDIVVTSPPYGDSRTTVAYGQYSRLASEWLGFSDAKQVDQQLMGGRRRRDFPPFRSDLLNDIVSTIRKNDKDRVLDVQAFFSDYERSINNVAPTVKKDGYACYVVGNRSVTGVTIPTDRITVELFQQNNFRHIETIVRNIPNKRMPSKNSPSNVRGAVGATMKNEYIVICQKI